MSEAEWEYLAVQFSSKHSEAEDSACPQANLADRRAESVAQLAYGTSYVNLIGIEQCDDFSSTVSEVGQYQPNKLGVYDLLGNVNEFVADCYSDSYQLMPKSGKAVTAPNCDTVVLRGGAWH